MKIAIDISQTVYGTGVSTYTKNLVENLLKVDKKNEYILFGGTLRRRKELKSILGSFKGNFQSRIFSIPPTASHFIWNRLHILPVEKFIGKIDILHSSDWSQPPSNAFKVTTVHDLVPIKYPKLSHPKIVSNQNSRFNHIINEVDRIIVPSKATAEDAEKLGISTEKLRVIPEAVDPIFKPSKKSEIEAVKRKYRISGKYVLSVGVNSRKNTERIIEAFEKINGEINIKLVIVGRPLSKVHEPRGVYFLGHVPGEVLPSLYSGAEALVYPSLYEGFGLPILEAFSCKLPVVTSNYGSMAEVADKAAVLVDPYDVTSIFEGVMKAMSGKDEYIRKGLKRAKDFSWRKTAEKTLSVYSESIN